MDMDAPDVMELMQALAKNSKKDVAEVCAQMHMMQGLSSTEIALCFGTWVQKMETTRRPETDDLVDQSLRYMQEGNLKMVTKTNQEIFDILVGRTRVSNSDVASTTSAGDVRHE